jgi:AraC family transcriptional regulator
MIPMPSRNDQNRIEYERRLHRVLEFKGLSSDVPALWDRLLREWFPESGYQLDARPCFEYYPVDGFFDEKTGAFSCELVAPVTRL